MIIIPVESLLLGTANLITGKAYSAFVSTRSIEDLENPLICDGGATCNLTKSLEICALCKSKVVQIQTAHGATLMNATQLCYKTFYVCVRLGAVPQIIVKAYVVPGWKHDLLLVNDLERTGMQSVIILIQSNLECIRVIA